MRGIRPGKGQQQGFGHALEPLKDEGVRGAARFFRSCSLHFKVGLRQQRGVWACIGGLRTLHYKGLAKTQLLPHTPLYYAYPLILDEVC